MVYPVDIEKESSVRAQAYALRQVQTEYYRGFVALILAVATLLATSLRADARGAPESFADLAEQVSPAVVNITTSTIVAGREGGPQPMIPEGSPFEEFFRDFLDRNQQGPNGGEPQQRQRRSQALGSGFVISEDGFIVTNNHVIEGADEILIEFFDREDQLEAKVVGTDPNTDIALLKVESDAPLAYVSFGDSDIMRVGDWVMAVGNPLGQGFSVSAGIVSQRNRELSGSYDDYIQTDAAINRGNSGGPLFNMDGQVIGVNTAILSPNGGSIGIGFAMSSAVVDRVVGQLKEFGETRRGWLGVRIQDITDDIAEALGLESTDGALVTDVPDGPAKEAGIQVNDVILSFDGVDVTDSGELVRTVGNAPVGKAVRVMILRDGKTETIKVTLGRREDAVAASNTTDEEPSAPAEPSKLLGMSLAPLDDSTREALGLNPGEDGLAVLDIDEDTEAFEKGIRAGDLISEAGQQPVATIEDLEASLQVARDGGRKSVLLLVRRDGNPRFVALSLEE
ncbi:Do family serine endopeptidase [Aliiroseovarius sp. S1123]|jgi:serine protease Do|uniref:Do family serine endopeptidase n=1 Tax=unclassified Aliiroseovarius TaxID=2623558 RepID=UPI001FF2BB83|nr:Do family serine endopeptidase [Aliiroseovarius sp. S1123]MCK0169925.1 Do family serine endopeptidase [Aliiroseovarius sp. S1123]